MFNVDDILKSLKWWEDGCPDTTSTLLVLICDGLKLEVLNSFEKEVDGNKYTCEVYTNGLVRYGVTMNSGLRMSSNSIRINEVFADEFKKFDDRLTVENIAVGLKGVKEAPYNFGIMCNSYDRIKGALMLEGFKKLERPSRYARHCNLKKMNIE